MCIDFHFVFWTSTLSFSSVSFLKTFLAFRIRVTTAPTRRLPVHRHYTPAIKRPFLFPFCPCYPDRTIRLTTRTKPPYVRRQRKIVRRYFSIQSLNGNAGWDWPELRKIRTILKTRVVEVFPKGGREKLVDSNSAVLERYRVFRRDGNVRSEKTVGRGVAVHCRSYTSYIRIYIYIMYDGLWIHFHSGGFLSYKRYNVSRRYSYYDWRIGPREQSADERSRSRYSEYYEHVVLQTLALVDAVFGNRPAAKSRTNFTRNIVPGFPAANRICRSILSVILLARRTFSGTSVPSPESRTTFRRNDGRVWKLKNERQTMFERIDLIENVVNFVYIYLYVRTLY